MVISTLLPIFIIVFIDPEISRRFFSIILLPPDPTFSHPSIAICFFAGILVMEYRLMG